MARKNTRISCCDIAEAEALGLPLKEWGSFEAFNAALEAVREFRRAQMRGKATEKVASGRTRLAESFARKLEAINILKARIRVAGIGYFTNPETGLAENIFKNMRREGEDETVIDLFEHLFSQVSRMEVLEFYRKQ